MSIPATIHIRLVVPRGQPHREHQELTASVLAFFRACGVILECNEKLLLLPRTIPAVLRGSVAQSTYERFLAEFPDVDRIVITATPQAQRQLQAA